MSQIAAKLEAVNLRVALVDDSRHWGDFASSWNALAGDVPFRSWEWAHTWWRHYRGARDRLMTLLVNDDEDQLVGVAPWYLNCTPSGSRVVRFLGSGEVCSDYLTLLAAPGAEEPVAHRVAQWLLTEGRRRWHWLDLSGIDASDPAIDHFCQRLAAGDHVVERISEGNCWRVSLPDSWDTFLATLSKSRRERLRAVLRHTFGQGRAVLRDVEHERELARAFDVLIDLHQKRRRSLSQPGCFASRRFERFHRELAHRFLANGRLRLQWIELDSRPMSIQYCFTGGDSVFYYQGGIEPELASESPGWVGVSAALKSAIEAGFRNYDFLRGDESYKASFKATAAPLVRVRAVNRFGSARLRYAALRTRELAKVWARRVVRRRED